MTQCPCGNAVEYSSCCEPYISGDRFAPSAEALMRSRYTAYVNGATAYLRSTLAPSSRGDYDENSVREWSKNSEWLGLQILSAGHDKVEFVAKYKTDGKVLEHHEVARFKKLQDRWYFIDGKSHVHEEGKGHESHHAAAPAERAEPKVGRNDPCTCGSGKKFKKCCGG